MEDGVIVLQAIQCPSLSGLSQLTYEYGLKSGSELMIRIAGNTGTGMYSEDWVPMNEVLNILRIPAHQAAISSIVLRPLYLGKSVNTPSFLLAALKHEEVVVPDASKRGAYQVSALSAFEERLEGLLNSSPGEPLRKPGGKRSNSKKAVSPE